MVFDYDYIVIGAGINGAWTGYHLAKLNQKTLIIEQVSKLKENICLTIFTFGILYAWTVWQDYFKLWHEGVKRSNLHDNIYGRALQMKSYENVFFSGSFLFLTVEEVRTVRVVAFERLIRKGWQVQKKKRPNLAMSSFKKVQSSKIKRPNFQRTFVKITKSILKS